MKDSLLRQLKDRRMHMGLKQQDMLMRAGMSRQQYQRLESRGNPRLDTLELLAEGLDSALMLIPKEKVRAVSALLKSIDSHPLSGDKASQRATSKSLDDDPWQGFLKDDL